MLLDNENTIIKRTTNDSPQFVCKEIASTFKRFFEDVFDYRKTEFTYDEGVRRIIFYFKPRFILEPFINGERLVSTGTRLERIPAPEIPIRYVDEDLQEILDNAEFGVRGQRIVIERLHDKLVDFVNTLRAGIGQDYNLKMTYGGRDVIRYLTDTHMHVSSMQIYFKFNKIIEDNPDFCPVNQLVFRTQVGRDMKYCTRVIVTQFISNTLSIRGRKEIRIL